jgi:hypothetical protein
MRIAKRSVSANVVGRSTHSQQAVNAVVGALSEESQSNNASILNRPLLQFVCMICDGPVVALRLDITATQRIVELA